MLWTEDMQYVCQFILFHSRWHSWLFLQGTSIWIHILRNWLWYQAAYRQMNLPYIQTPRSPLMQHTIHHTSCACPFSNRFPTVDLHLRRWISSTTTSCGCWANAEWLCWTRWPISIDKGAILVPLRLLSSALCSTYFEQLDFCGLRRLWWSQAR